ncbi:MAG: AtpZ/AtpI family protein [Oscillospiraceae bacterium]|nr:AtpZ/AtpI family protein [Oscillospiraceae bacterium]
MKYLSLITWVTQLGFSILFPTCFFLMLAYWLQNRFGLGPWVMVVLGIIGLLTSFSTTKSCVRSMLKAAGEITEDKSEPPVAFNNHH